MASMVNPQRLYNVDVWISNANPYVKCIYLAYIDILTNTKHFFYNILGTRKAEDMKERNFYILNRFPFDVYKAIQIIYFSQFTTFCWLQDKLLNGEWKGFSVLLCFHYDLCSNFALYRFFTPRFIRFEYKCYKNMCMMLYTVDCVLYLGSTHNVIKKILVEYFKVFCLTW